MADAAHTHHDHVHGDQDIREQEATFALFGFLTKWGSLATAVLIVLFTLWFRPGGGLLQGLGGAVVLAVVGVFVLKSKPAAHE